MKAAYILLLICIFPGLAQADADQAARFGSLSPNGQAPAKAQKLALDKYFQSHEEAQLIPLAAPQPIIEQPIGLLPADHSGPLSFEQLLQAAYAHHPLIRRSMFDQMVAKTDITVAKQAYYPTPNVSVNIGEHGRQVLSAGLTQPLYTFGKLSTGVNQAQVRESIATLAIDETRQSVALSLVNLWRNYLAAALQITVFQNTLDRYEEYHAMILRRFEGGRSSQADITFVESRISQTESDLKATEARRNTTLSQLSQVTGLMLNSQSLRIPDLPSQDNQNLSTTIAQSLYFSPLLKRTQAEVEQAEVDAARARANMLPNVNLNLQMDRYANGVDINGFNRPNEQRLMLNMQYTPGAGLSSYYQYESVAQRIAGRQAAVDAARQDINNAVTAQKIDLDQGFAQFESIAASVNSNREVLNSYGRQFAVGQRTWIDLLNAARDLSGTELSQANLQANINAADRAVKIYRGELQLTN